MCSCLLVTLFVVQFIILFSRLAIAILCFASGNTILIILGSFCLATFLSLSWVLLFICFKSLKCVVAVGIIATFIGFVSTLGEFCTAIAVLVINTRNCRDENAHLCHLSIGVASTVLAIHLLFACCKSSSKTQDSSTDTNFMSLVSFPSVYATSRQNEQTRDVESQAEPRY
ncbi:hypothetical protein M3Y97_00693900 [Aphelenchoides bicaudatus]|nr:hypothetical protein M3Y97_00693900 [Aphelenchoides bicaudatus]